MQDTSTLAILVKSDGIKEASAALSGMSTSANNAEKRVTALTLATEKLNTVSKLATTQAQSYNTQLITQMQTLSQLRVDTSSTAAATTALAKAMSQLSASLQTVVVNNNAARTSQNSYNASMADGHALARGLSGSLGALWMTYGSLVPLAAGVALGASLKGIVSVGKDVENTLESIRVMGESTTSEISDMRDTILTLGQGVQGPKDVAEALSVLVLAGLSAGEAMKGVGAALSLAIVGGVSVEKASSTLVQVGTSLGYTADGFEHVADVIAKTAAVSMSSVESISGAFKSASAVGELYGSTLTDIGTGLAALSNLGIQGTAAGTSLKNFFKDLSSGSEKVTTTFEDMKMSIKDLKDSEGYFIPLIDVIKKLDAGLGTLTGKDRQDALGKLFGERGVKEGAALIKMLHTVSTEVNEFGETYANKLEEVNDRVSKSYAFATLGAIAMSQTTEAQLKSVANTLQTKFLEAFQEVSPQIGEVARALKNAFNSPEFITAIKLAATLVADLTKFIVEHREGISQLIEAYLAFKAVQIATVFIEMAGALGKTALAFDIASVASRGFVASLGPIGIAIAGLTTLWMLYKAAKADATNDRSSINSLTDQVNQLKEADEKQRKWLEQKRRGLTEAQMAEEDSQKSSKAALAKGLEDSAKNVEAMRKEVAMRETLLSASEKQQMVMKGANPNANVSSRVEGLITSTQRLNEAEKIHNKNMADSDVLTKSLMAGSKEKTNLLDAEAKANRIKPTGDGELSVKTPKEAKEKISAFDALNKLIQEKISIEDEQLSSSHKLTDAEKFLYRTREDLRLNLQKLTPAEKALTEVELDKLAALIPIVAVHAQLLQNEKAREESAWKAVEVATKEIEKNEELLRTYGMTKEQIEQLQLSRMKDELQRSIGLELSDSEIERQTEVDITTREKP